MSVCVAVGSNKPGHARRRGVDSGPGEEQESDSRRIGANWR